MWSDGKNKAAFLRQHPRSKWWEIKSSQIVSQTGLLPPCCHRHSWTWTLHFKREYNYARFAARLCGLTVFPSIFVSQVRWNVTSWVEARGGKKPLHRLHWCLQSSITRNDSAGTVPSAIEIIKWNILDRLLTRLQCKYYFFFFTKSIFVTYCQFLHLERQGLSLGQQAGRGEKSCIYENHLYKLMNSRL